MANTITINAIINAPMDVVWETWNNPEHVQQWNHASDDWECPAATNDLRVGGKFSYTMAAKDKSSSFDFSGTYTTVDENKQISYTMDDGRKVDTLFEEADGAVNVTTTFEMENQNSEELQRNGWQAILDNFKAYAEARA